MNKGDVRYAIAYVVGALKSSFACRQKCSEGIYRVVTESAEASRAVIYRIPGLGGELLFFQAYDIDDNGEGGSVFLIGGDRDLMSNIILLWLVYPGEVSFNWQE